MSEAEWLEGPDPVRLLEFVRGTASDRKLRLFACACCRRVWDLLTDARSRRVVEVAERYADGEATDEEMGRAEWYAEAAYFRAADREDQSRRAYRLEQRLIERGHLDPEDGVAESPVANLSPAVQAAHAADLTAYDFDSFLSGVEPSLLSRPLVYDIFGNPFRPPALNPSRLPPTVVTLARAIYAERAFDRLPILADALEEAGCDNAEVLAHCRGDGPHARGCWVVDLLLGRS